MNPILSKIENRLGLLQFQIDSHFQGQLLGSWTDGKVAQIKEEILFLEELKKQVQ